ncbi:ComF family protein [Corynebacterium sp.]|uniref:ComF family protein n=1 Tax=Corynebacterium sp. TaxID=1720 RepID=UPI0026DC1CB0|nr:phosphoribosyltransferase family protein [Corynebacterium sp.]MDO5032105.1 phosphoribosyltransferase family protein [Corynebacterium sp.]
MGVSGIPARRAATRAAAALAAATELILPRPCAGCGAETTPGHSLCPRCQHHLRRVPQRIERPEPLGFPVRALGPYSDIRRSIIVAMKERGHRALRGHLAAVYAAGLDYLRARGDIPETALLVPAPTRAASARARGGDPVEGVCSGVATRLPGWQVAPCLQIARGSADQSELSASERARNMRGAVELLPNAAALRGRAVLLVDDVVTTGSTLRASAARLWGVGAQVAGALVLAEA